MLPNINMKRNILNYLSAALLFFAVSCGSEDPENGNGVQAEHFVVASLPDGVQGGDFGRHATVATGEEGKPVAVYSLAGDGKESLYFSRWENGEWISATLVEEVDSIDGRAPHRQISIAYDSEEGLTGIAYIAGRNDVRMALSRDGGKNWDIETVSEKDPDRPRTVSNPSIVLQDGEIHLAYWQGDQRDDNGKSDAIWYLNKDIGAASFSREISPLLPGTLENLDCPFGLALDPEGKPGLAYFLAPDSSVQHRYNISLAFWRPGEAEAVLILESKEYTYGGASVSLAFSDEKAVVSLHHRLEQEERFLFAASSDDGGITWSSPVMLPLDANDRTGTYQALAVSSEGEIAIAAVVNRYTGANPGRWGSPKVYLSHDLSSWQITSPVDGPPASTGPKHVSLSYDLDGYLHLVFQNESMASLPLGVIHWRLPPAE